MLEKMYGFSRSNDFNTKNYTLTRSKIDEPLAQYVHDNINLYVEVILDNCRERIDDDEMAVLELLNNLELDKDRKVQYIDTYKR